MNLKEKIQLERFGIMQLRSRKLPTVRRSRIEETVSNLESQLKYALDMNANLHAEIENLVRQRDDYARQLKIELGILPRGGV
jgi:hypothetical protein